MYQAGFDLFATHPDKAWSLADCISFGVIDRGLSEALTADHRFAQAGFRVVCKEQRQASATRHNRARSGEAALLQT